MALFTPSASPAVTVKEIDLTGVVPNVQTSTGAFVGNFGWGPVGQATLVSDESGLVSTFSAPTTSNTVDFHSAAYFLRYSNALYVVREADSDAVNAVANNSNIGSVGAQTINNLDAFEDLSLDSSDGAFIAKYPGELGNALKISIVGSDSDNGGTTNFNAWAYKSSFDGAPGTSSFVSALGGKNDEIHVAVIDEDGFISGTAGTVLETFPFLSVASNAKSSDGTSNYYKDVLKLRSQWVYATGGWHGVADAINGVAAIYSAPTVESGTFTLQLTDGTTTVSVDAATYSDVAGQVTAIQGDSDYSNLLYTVSANGTNLILTYKSQGAVSTAPTVTRGGASITVSETTAGVTGVAASENVDFHGSNWDTQSTATGEDFATGQVNSAVESTWSFTSGVTSSSLGTDDVLRGFDKFEDADAIEVDFLIAPESISDTNAASVVNDLVATAESLRKDCVVVASPSRNAAIAIGTNAAVVTNNGSYTKSTYLVQDNNYLKVFDKYNDQYIKIPAASSTAGLMAATDLVAAPWFSPAGSRRGRYLGITDIVLSPTKSERDTLYKAGINPIANIPGEGIMLFGDKTNSSRPSAFDRINVRRLFLGIERAIALAGRNVMFEFNDEFTRAEFVNIVEPFLREIQGRRGITDFRVVCDETNNTPAVVDRNEFIANIFIKPARSINYVTLNFVAVRTGVEFEEVVGTV
jgi:phage tail sheath protein FI